MVALAARLLTNLLPNHRGIKIRGIGFKVKTVNFLAGRIMLQNKLSKAVYLRRLRRTIAQRSCLMAQADAMLVFKITCPGRYRLKIVNNQVVFAHRTSLHFFNEAAEFRMDKGFPQIYPTRFAKNKTQTLQAVFHFKG